MRNPTYINIQCNTVHGKVIVKSKISVASQLASAWREKKVICQCNLPTLQLNTLVVEHEEVWTSTAIHVIGGQMLVRITPSLLPHHIGLATQGLPVLRVGWSAFLRVSSGCDLWPPLTCRVCMHFFTFALMTTGAFSQMLFSELKLTTDNLHLCPTCWEDAKMFLPFLHSEILQYEPKDQHIAWQIDVGG